MRKSYQALAAAATALAMVAVGPGAGVAASAATKTAALASPPFVIGVSNDSVANPFRVQMLNEVKYYAQTHPNLIKKVIYLNADGDTNTQIADVEDLISAHVNGILLSPNSATAFASVLKSAKAAGIPVATYNMSITTGASDIIAQVAPPFTAWEQSNTAWLAQQMHGKGNVVVFRGLAGTPVDAEEWAGAQAVLKANPGIKVVCTEYAAWDYGTAKTAAQNCLANHPTVNGILSFGDAMTWAVGQVMTNMGYNIADIPFIGIGGGNGAICWWAKLKHSDGQMLADRTDVSAFAAQDLVNYLTGKAGVKAAIPKVVISNSNVSKYANFSMPANVWLIGTSMPLPILKKWEG
jgi:ribose transport system substrate-binding protein